MKQAFLLVYINFDSPDKEASFIETITGNFVSKKAGNNQYFIISDRENQSSDIYKLIESKNDFDSDFLVVRLDNFFGNFDDGATDWLKEKLPNWTWINKKN